MRHLSEFLSALQRPRG